MSLEDKDDDEVLAYYLEIGVVNLEGMDENGELIYSINQEMAKEYAPELWQSHIDYVDKSLINLYEAGLAEIEYNEDNAPRWWILSPSAGITVLEGFGAKIDLNNGIAERCCLK